MADARHPDEELAADLVRRITAGDREAEARLVELHGRGLTFLLQHLTGDHALAEDLYQETFRIVLEKARQGALREPGKLAGFIRGTARNLCHRLARHPRTVDIEALAEPRDPAPNPLDDRLLEEDQRHVRRILRELASDRDRQLLYRFYIAEEPKERICAALGLGRRQFNVAIFRARQRFKKLLLSSSWNPGRAEAR